MIVSLLVPSPNSLSLESTPKRATLRYPVPLSLASLEIFNLSASSSTVSIFASLLASSTAPAAATIRKVPPTMEAIFFPRDQEANPRFFFLRPRR